MTASASSSEITSAASNQQKIRSKFEHLSPKHNAHGDIFLSGNLINTQGFSQKKCLQTWTGGPN